MKEITITENMNGFVVKVDERGKSVPQAYVFRRVDDLIMLEFVGKILAQRRVKVETV